MNELTALIEFSPTNLGNFFDHSIDELEEDVPHFGHIKNGKNRIFLLSNDDKL